MNGLLRTSIELLPVDEGHADVINPKPTTTDLSVNRSHVISARMKTILQTAGEHDLFELCEAVCAKYTALVERENRLEEDIGRKKTEMEELRDVEMNLQARVHELEGDLYAHKIRTRNMETEKNQEIRKLQKEIKELEKTKKITLNRDKQYQHSLRKMETFTKKLQDTIEKIRSTPNARVITPATSSSRTIRPSTSTQSLTNASNTKNTVESFMAHLRSSYADQIAELEGENQYLRDSLKELQTQLNHVLEIVGVDIADAENLITNNDVFNLPVEYFSSQMKHSALALTNSVSKE